MNVKDTPRLTAIEWLVRDTFRQSIAHGIFWVLLVLSGLAIVMCLTISVNGRSTMNVGDENPDFISRNDPDAKDAEKLEMSGVVVADTIGLLLTLIWTAGFLPSFLEGRNISVLLAKPAPRWVLLLGKYLGVLAFVLFQSVVFVGGTWLAIGARTGFWDPTYFWAIPLLLLQFSIFFAFSVLLPVWTHNTVVCVFGSIVFWCVAWSMNFGRHVIMTADDMLSTSVRSSFFSTVVDFGYWVLPKPADLGLLLYNALGAGNHFGSALDLGSLEAQGFSMLASVLTSAAFGAFVLFASARMFQATDY